MSIGEKFSIEKFLDFSPSAWYTVFGLALKVVVFVLLIFGALWVKNLLFPPAPANVTNPAFNVSEGGNVTYNVVQQSNKKRAWYIPSPFVEIYGQKESKRDFDTGIRVGGRWDF